jgi:hypothetical protein
MRSKTSDLINVARDDVRVVQLVLMPGPMVSIKDGQAISVTGTLFGSHTGHHRTPVLIQVQAVKDAIQQPVVDRRLQLASLGRRRGKTGTLDGRKAEGRR